MPQELDQGQQRAYVGKERKCRTGLSHVLLSPGGIQRTDSRPFRARALLLLLLLAEDFGRPREKTRSPPNGFGTTSTSSEPTYPIPFSSAPTSSPPLPGQLPGRNVIPQHGRSFRGDAARYPANQPAKSLAEHWRGAGGAPRRLHASGGGRSRVEDSFRGPLRAAKDHRGVRAGERGNYAAPCWAGASQIAFTGLKSRSLGRVEGRGKIQEMFGIDVSAVS